MARILKISLVSIAIIPTAYFLVVITVKAFCLALLGIIDIAQAAALLF